MKKKIETIKTGIKDIILELEYNKEDICVWITREDFGIKILMWGILITEGKTKKQIIEISIDELLENYSYYKEKLEL